MRPARGYRGPHVVLTPAGVARVLRWAAADQQPDDTTRAVRAQCEAAINARQIPKKGTP
jgi:hypothetical protein